MFNVVTIAREYGSGGAEIGRKVAELLAWECIDKQIIERVAAMGNVDRSWAEKVDEQSCAWWERVMSGFRHSGPELCVGGMANTGVALDIVQEFTARVIEQAAREGNCVVVGRGSQCVLRNTPRVLHVMVYAPMVEKVERLKRRHPRERDLQALVHRMDSERWRYTQDYYGRDWSDRGLYQLCVNSTMGFDACAKLIVSAVRLAETKQPTEVGDAPAVTRG